MNKYSNYIEDHTGRIVLYSFGAIRLCYLMIFHFFQYHFNESQPVAGRAMGKVRVNPGNFTEGPEPKSSVPRNSTGFV